MGHPNQPYYIAINQEARSFNKLITPSQDTIEDLDIQQSPALHVRSFANRQGSSIIFYFQRTKGYIISCIRKEKMD